MSRTPWGARVLGGVVFVSGAVLLGVEIAASRVLAPTFGTSLYVWGSLIGVVLTGLALGYALGGRAADRWPSPFLLVAALGLGALLVLAIPLVDRAVLDAITAWDPGPRLDPLLAAAALFGPMSIVLASVTPIAVRLAARSIERLGTTAGRLFSISTAGSIVGTFVTAFWLVPEHGTDQVLALGAAALLVAALVLATVERLAVAAVALAGALVATGVAVVKLAPDATARLEGSAARNWSPLVRARDTRVPRKLDPASVELLASGFTVREARETRYHRMLIVEDDDSRYLRFDNSFQSGMWLDDAVRTRFAYSDYLHLGFAYKPDAKRVLVIGLGGGAFQKRVHRDFDDVEVTTVELDPDVVDAAYRWFALPRDARRLPVVTGDGRRFLREDARRWDLIVVDAFYADGVPFHLTTLEFVELLRSRLVPGGVVATNVIGSLVGDESRLLRAVTKTYGGVFPTVRLHPVFEGPTDRVPEYARNIVLVATERAAPPKRQLARSWAEVRELRAPRAPDLRAAIGDRWSRVLPADDVPYLTDGYAPTDALLVD